jgi:hypothetical protein
VTAIPGAVLPRRSLLHRGRPVRTSGRPCGALPSRPVCTAGINQAARRHALARGPMIKTRALRNLPAGQLAALACLLSCDVPADHNEPDNPPNPASHTCRAGFPGIFEPAARPSPCEPNGTNLQQRPPLDDACVTEVALSRCLRSEPPLEGCTCPAALTCERLECPVDQHCESSELGPFCAPNLAPNKGSPWPDLIPM